MQDRLASDMAGARAVTAALPDLGTRRIPQSDQRLAVDRFDHQSPDFGAFVVSLDFELLWGVRDGYPSDGGAYRANLLGGRAAIPRMLDLFEEFGVAATWTTVGFLFARSRQELLCFRPTTLPAYADSRLCPYREPVGLGEDDDPLHFAPSLIESIRACPSQEIGTHTFSHFYCLEPGSTRAAFKADLDSAIAIAAEHGLQLRSIVFPRNQFNPDYADLLVEAGVTCYRGTERHSIYQAASVAHANRAHRRGARLLDAYLGFSGPNVQTWQDVPQASGLSDVSASCFLRPYSPRLRHLDSLRLHRIARGIQRAASTPGIFHLWWHPHNMGLHVDDNFRFLRNVLEVFAWCRERHGMRSLTMAEVADTAARMPTGDAATRAIA
jgi:peptidoglycan/xylan/chitin deacetylase (PgdA/CDA1 family)